MDDKERTRVLGATLGQIEKQFGKGSIMRLGNRDVLVPVSVIPTGSISIDAALGIGGFLGRLAADVFSEDLSDQPTA